MRHYHHAHPGALHRQMHMAHWGEGRGGRFGRGPMGGPGRGHRRRLFDAGEFQLVLLKLIAERPRHGYDLIVALEEITGGAYVPSPGVIYPTLTLLQDMGLIEAEKEDGPRKVFSATDQGKAHLAEGAEQANAILARLTSLAEQEGRGKVMPVRRAMENLRSALRNRLSGEVSEEVLNGIVEILDDTARRIERL